MLSRICPFFFLFFFVHSLPCSLFFHRREPRGGRVSCMCRSHPARQRWYGWKSVITHTCGTCDSGGMFVHTMNPWKGHRAVEIFWTWTFLAIRNGKSKRDGRYANFPGYLNRYQATHRKYHRNICRYLLKPPWCIKCIQHPLKDRSWLVCCQQYSCLPELQFGVPWAGSKWDTINISLLSITKIMYSTMRLRHAPLILQCVARQSLNGLTAISGVGGERTLRD